MNTTMSRGLIRLVAGPVVAAGLIGGALGLAAVADASTTNIHPHDYSIQPHDSSGTSGTSVGIKPDGIQHHDSSGTSGTSGGIKPDGTSGGIQPDGSIQHHDSSGTSGTSGGSSGTLSSNSQADILGLQGRINRYNAIAQQDQPALQHQAAEKSGAASQLH